MSNLSAVCANSQSPARFDPSVFQLDSAAQNVHPSVLRFHSQSLACATAVVEEALARYPVDHLAIAFNGGKDCTVLLDFVVRIIRSKPSSQSHRITALYLRSRPQFPVLETFIREKVEELTLDLVIYDGDIKSSLWKFKADFPTIEGIFMGTRVKDPSSSHLKHFSPTDPSWAPFMRILPILHMSYHEVWLYLRHFGVRYCGLYDQGFTSIGWEGNTLRNPKLKIVSADGATSYKPAYMLEDSDDERTSRD